MLQKSINSFLFIICAGSVTGCGNTGWLSRGAPPSSGPIVMQVTEYAAEDMQGIGSMATFDAQARSLGVTEASRVITATVKLNKSAIEDRTFLYGFDQQGSTTRPLGHVPAKFRRIGDFLQLVGDKSYSSPMDRGAPEVLLAEFRVVEEDAESLSVTFERPGISINNVMHGANAPAPTATWVRSLDFVEDGSYLLQESGILLPDGTAETYMESIFPRDSLVPESYVPLLNDPAKEPLAVRYRFISNEKVFLPFTVDGVTVRQETSIANRFHLDPAGRNGGHIDFYVSPTIPDVFMPAVQSAVEGWNRYFEPQLGYKVMRFLGRLPPTAKVGDPRYNVISWDSNPNSVWANEDDASDPTSGIQSHSLINMPISWFQRGVDLWHDRVDAGSDAGSPLGRAMIAAPVTAEQLISALNADDVTVSPQSADDFGMRGFAAVLHHEVGHSLGLSHNFKGSLSFDGSRGIAADNPGTWSVMDYNYSQHELNIFNTLGESDGPILEYDRQIVSQLYDAGKDVLAGDPVIPACSDAEADRTDGGVDPLCTRYDAEREPTSAVQHALDNILKATGAAGYERHTLVEALADSSPAIARKLADGAAPDSASLIASSQALGEKFGRLIRFYFDVGPQSLRGNLANNGKMLRVWKTNTGFASELVARQTYFNAASVALTWTGLPADAASAVAGLTAQVQTTVLASAGAGADGAARAQTAAAAEKAFAQAVDDQVQQSLTSLRQGIISTLGYAGNNPFAIDRSATLPEFEAWAAQTLAALTVQSLDTVPDVDVWTLAPERLAAAATLAGYRGHDDAVIDSAIAQLEAQVSRGRTTRNQNLVIHARALLEKFGR